MAHKNKKVLSRRKPVSRTRVAAVRKKPAKRALLVHHRQTFRLLPHAHTSYPLLMLMLLLVGVLLSGWTSATKADDFGVNAKVKGVPPGVAAVITSPKAGTTFQSIPVMVDGTCPLDSYINLYRNNFFSGTALCDANGNFQLQSDLFTGSNQLQARVFNKTDDEGPISGTVTVNYTPPEPIVPPTTHGGGSPSTGGGSQTPTPGQLALSTNFLYRGYYAGQNVIWKFNVSGGTAPYAIKINWGDGSSSLVSRSTSGDFTVPHTYAKQPGYGNAYTVKLEATDGAAQTAYLQIVAIVNQPQGSAHGLPVIGSTGGMPPVVRDFLKFVWPTYMIALVVVAGFWLGERRELQLLRPHGPVRH